MTAGAATTLPLTDASAISLGVSGEAIPSDTSVIVGSVVGDHGNAFPVRDIVSATAHRLRLITSVVVTMIDGGRACQQASKQ